jgi:predicted NBD/HSP70 family sugar kinase
LLICLKLIIRMPRWPRGSNGNRKGGVNTRRLGRGTHAVNMRRYNELTLLQRLRRVGEASKADLARAAQLTNTAVGSIVGALEDAGLIESSGRRQNGSRGQPAALYRLNPKGAFGVGVRLDRARIEIVLADLSGRILVSKAHDMLLPNPEQALKIVQRDVAAVLKTLAPTERRRLAGIGLAQPYHLGRWLLELDLQADFRLWDEIDFSLMLGDATKLPVFKDNDGTAAAIAELLFGIGRVADDFFYLFIGAAIGGGVVINGEGMHGRTGNAADVGLIPVAPSALASAPQAPGSGAILLSRASLNVLRRHLSHHGVRACNRAELAGCFDGGHPAVLEWLDDCVGALVPAVRSAVAVLDVPVCVIDSDVGGGLIDELIRRLDAGLNDIAPEWRVAPQIKRGSFGADAGALGAASLPMFFHFAPRADMLRGRHLGPSPAPVSIARVRH